MKRLIIIHLALIIALCSYAVKPFEFALLTDVHVSPNSTQALEDLQNSINEIRKNKKVKFVIVSGDLTEAGDSLCMTKVKAELDRLKVPYYVTSGNHETKWSESGCTDFAEVFGADRFSFVYNDVCFIGFNSGPVIKMADGHVAPQDIAWIQSILEAQPKGRAVIPVTHYPLQEGDVDNWFDVTNLLRQYNVQVVIGGHYHRNLLFSADGIPDVLNRSNLRGKKAVGGYSLISVANDSIRFCEKVIGKKKVQWLSLPFEQKNYGEGDKSLLPSMAVNQEFKQVEELWQTNLKVGIYAAPVMYKEQVFIGDDEGKFYALNAKTGKIIWTYQTASRIVSTAACTEKSVIFGSTDGGIYCLRQDDGALIWKHQTNAAVMGCAIIVPECKGSKVPEFNSNGLLEHRNIGTVEHSVVLIGGNKAFYCLDAETGKLLWVNENPKSYIECKPLIWNDLVIFGAWDCNLYALNIKTGELVWQWNNGKRNDKFSPAAVWPVAVDNQVFIVAPDRYMTALDAKTGEQIWRTNEHKVRESIGVTADGTTILSRCMNDTVLALTAVKEPDIQAFNTGEITFTTTQKTIANEKKTTPANAGTPKLLWKNAIMHGYDHNPSMITEMGGVLMFGTKNGVLIAMNTADGKVLWQHKVGNSVINTALQLSNNECIISSSDGKVTRLKVQ